MINKKGFKVRKVNSTNRYYTDIESIDGKVYVLDLKNRVYKKLRERSYASRMSVLYCNIFLIAILVFIYLVFCSKFIPARYQEMSLHLNNLIFLVMGFFLYALVDCAIAGKWYQHYLDLLYRYILIRQGESTFIFVSKKYDRKLDMKFLGEMGLIVDNKFLNTLSACEIDDYLFDDRGAILTVQLLEQVNIIRYIKEHKSDFSFEVYTDCKLIQSKKNYDLYSGIINISKGQKTVEKRKNFRVYKVYSENNKFKNGMISNDN